MNPKTQAAKVAKGDKIVCDNCRHRRIRCDYSHPCGQCQGCSLTCTRDYVPQRRGPKRGQGRVIKQLRARGALPGDNSERPLTPTNSSGASPSTPDTLECYRPSSKSYGDLVPRCVELYYEHIYPIMPLLYKPDIEQMLQRPLRPHEQTLLYALSAKTCFHMRGQGLQATGPDSWERAGRFFLDECEASRKTYDYIKEISLFSVISSFWMSTSSFEIKDDWKSAFYLKEALAFALELRLDNESSYSSLSLPEDICHRRTFWQLFVTERSLAIFRQQDIQLRKSPSLPTASHPYESPEITAGFLQLISTYQPLDESFVRAWNDGTSAAVDISTFLALQQSLSPPPSFLTSQPGTYQPTTIQKADLLITQQWLRLTVWKSFAARYPLTRNGPDESTRVMYPASIAHRTAAILSSLPAAAVQAHGMGILEKIFEIGRAWVNIMEFCEYGGEGRSTITIDPLGVFMSTLGACVESERAFAGTLRGLVKEKPTVLRCELGVALRPAIEGAESGRVVEVLNDDVPAEGSVAGQLDMGGYPSQMGTVISELSPEAVASPFWDGNIYPDGFDNHFDGWFHQACPRSHGEVSNPLSPSESGVRDDGYKNMGDRAPYYQAGAELEKIFFAMEQEGYFQG